MPSIIEESGLRISIDRGGTFTDCVARVPGKDDIVIKILSVDPRNYADAPSEAIRQVLEQYHRKSIPRGSKLDLSGIEWIRMGTTVATNALLERKGERTALLITEGFKDLLHIGNQSRPHMFDMAISKPDVLYSKVVEVSERVVLEQCTESGRLKQSLTSPAPVSTAVGITGEVVHIVKPLDVEQVRRDLQGLAQEGFKALAVCLMHSYTFTDHETQILGLAREAGFEHVSLSSQVSQRTKIVPRGNSATVDAYLTPAIQRYLDTFTSNFEDLEGSQTKIEFMQSDGGLVPHKKLSGLKSILSGPAGGVVGYAETSYDRKNPVPVIGFDMGGTSTDVSRYNGALEHIFEMTTAGVVVQSPQLDINTIAAGGGSILTWKNGLLTVGPESASSHPGPACYRKGGPLTVTDANLFLGRLVPQFFPSIFGPNEDEPLDREATAKKFHEITELINNETGRSLSAEEIAEGFLKVANASMCGPIRTLTEGRGHDTSKHDLSCFGGAGGQHACSIAENLRIKRVLVHKYSSILSAYGIGLADVVHEEQLPCAKAFDTSTSSLFTADLDALEDKARESLLESGFRGTTDCQRFLSMRYDGSDTSIMTLADSETDIRKSFVESHHREFGFTPKDRPIIVDELRIRAVGKSSITEERSAFDELRSIMAFIPPPKPALLQPIYFDQLGWTATPVYTLQTLEIGTKITGPALVIDKTQTILINPKSVATILSGMVVIDVVAQSQASISSTTLDPIQLSVFRHRFMGVAEQMGRALQKTSVSANIKERLDFSCAIFTPEGDLVANAPHVPAMIGSMAFAVRGQIDLWKGKLQDGDVLLSNSPEHGGVHLPDFTVITPVFDDQGKDIIFWAASRGHHADVGGILPGSMPPTSREIWEEGALVESFLLVRDGIFAEKELTKLIYEDPAQYPGCSGTRCLGDNISDLKAQAAANYTGIRLIHQLIAEYTMDVVQYYMKAIQDSAELAVRNLLKDIARTTGNVLQAVDFMDDGTPICLKITIDSDTGSAIFDFTGTGPEVYGNWNAPIAICNSAVIYSLRCLVKSDIPLNQGCINPINIIVTEGSLLNPNPEAAVCAGNVLTSQRLVDVIFKAFGAMAASQGCMNNFTFGINGDEGFGYYETICGGSGAGNGWHGTSGVHTNMTNTRITDPESLERRYPVVLRKFSLRADSGGDGQYRGGNGVVRDVEFRIPMTASILSERRSFAPYGMNGGEDAARGLNQWVRKNGRTINLGGKNSVAVVAGERVVINTPGGGGYGPKSKWTNGTESELSVKGSAFTPIANGTVEMIRSLGESA
ncbi:Hydantoinase B/oxoprolinase-domain-containing protein [Leptodontidium sp. 2 PMI_412]|nr:Hydantoinase B/oxoprolinase-domain-containing protein [Leptodontidium sp. 2 PMI_412]